MTVRKHPTETDYAYFAGLLDGEGWIGSAKSASGSHAPRIQIGMTNYEVLQWCQDRFGGHIHQMNSRLATKQAWKWNMSSNAIRLYIPPTIPFMKVKRAQAELAVDWVTNWTGSGGTRMLASLLTKQEELWTSLKALNQSTH